MKVYDGYKSRRSEIVRWDASVVPVDVVSSSNKMIVEFKSNKCGQKSGFLAYAKEQSKSFNS